MPVIFDEGVIKWTSMSAYLPLMGMVGVIAYLRCTQKTAFRRILFTSLVMALVPALNSAFYAMNSSYYARWWYMPILVMYPGTFDGRQLRLFDRLPPSDYYRAFNAI